MRVPVLIVGGGPVGLAASVCLSRAGVASLLWMALLTVSPRAGEVIKNRESLQLPQFQTWNRMA